MFKFHTAQHTHDCDQCVYLGSRLDEDYYFCPGDKTVIARFGNDGAYRSVSLEDVTPTSSDLLLATLLALQQGLIDIKDVRRLPSQ